VRAFEVKIPLNSSLTYKNRFQFVRIECNKNSKPMGVRLKMYATNLIGHTI